MKDESKVNQRDVLIDEGKRTDIEALGDCLRALGDGQVLGNLSLTIVLYAKNNGVVEQEGETSPAFSPMQTVCPVHRYLQFLDSMWYSSVRQIYLPAWA